jgi:hypothetical protein
MPLKSHTSALLEVSAQKKAWKNGHAKVALTPTQTSNQPAKTV